MSTIRRNAAKCLKCDTVLESRHRHDFQQCECGNVFVDGGLDYMRRGVREPRLYLPLSEWEEE